MLGSVRRPVHHLTVEEADLELHAAKPPQLVPREALRCGAIAVPGEALDEEDRLWLRGRKLGDLVLVVG